MNNCYYCWHYSDPYKFMVTGNLKPRESIDSCGVYKHLKLFHRFSLVSLVFELTIVVMVSKYQWNLKIGRAHV